VIIDNILFHWFVLIYLEVLFIIYFKCSFAIGNISKQ
jgi:hypothetical protein